MNPYYNPAELRRAAVFSARLHGCNCHPEVQIVRLDGGVLSGTVLHDDWCVLYRRIRDGEGGAP